MKYSFYLFNVLIPAFHFVHPNLLTTSTTEKYKKKFKCAIKVGKTQKTAELEWIS